MASKPRVLCSDCKKNKKRDQFSKNQMKKSKDTRACKACVSKKQQFKRKPADPLPHGPGFNAANNDQPGHDSASKLLSIDPLDLLDVF